MVDFGFAGFIERFEARFGKELTTALLCLIAITITAACLDSFYDNAVMPIMHSVSNIYKEQFFSFESFWNLIRGIIIFILICAVIMGFLRQYNLRIQARDISEALARIDLKVKENEAQILENKSLISRNESLIRKLDSLSNVKDTRLEEVHQTFERIAKSILAAQIPPEGSSDKI